MNLTQVDNTTNAVTADRTLATIVEVKSLVPIEGADKIIVAEIEGWRCVVNKTDFSVGDMAIYYCIDSIPDMTDPNVKFLVDKGVKRIKTMKLRGVVSQGLLGPISWLADRGFDIKQFNVGDDVTEQMGVTKYVKDEELGQYCSGKVLDLAEHFPSSVPKTDEDRLQNNLKYINGLIDRVIAITRKEDGCSCSFIYEMTNEGSNKFSVCGRNFAWLDGNVNSVHYFFVENKYKVKEKMIAYGRHLGIQGEIVGPKINGNKLKLTEYFYRVFNIYDIDAKKYLHHDEVGQICSMLGLDQVPQIYFGHSNDLILNIDSQQVHPFKSTEVTCDVKKILNGFLDLSRNLEYTKGCPAEGIVIKTSDDMGPRISFKVISDKFLLKHDE